MLEIIDLNAEIEGKPILKGFSLTVKPGQIHAIMGPNGAGKSTLAKVIAGHPSYTITGGQVLFHDQDILALEPNERALLGLFMSFQYPVEIAGVSNKQFLLNAYNLRQKTPITEEAFEKLLDETLDKLSIPYAFKERNVNEGFSGGEKKRNEILQMALLDPKIAILDETDSGLDIDALKVVSRGVNALMNPHMGLILITHYQRLLNYIEPHFIHVMRDGKIIKSAGKELALELETKGYDWL